MLEFDRNPAIDPGVLAEFFARCGWEEPEAAVKLGWALASSEEWVACRLNGELMGFGRSYRLDAVRRLVFDVVVDPRLADTGLKALIVQALSEGAGSLEEVSVFEPGMGSLRTPGQGSIRNHLLWGEQDKQT